MEFTGERWVPGLTPWDVELEHIARYEACVSLVGGKVVLDAACGAGYGTAMLGTRAKRAMGIDIDSEAVESASASYGSENVSFMVGSVETLPVDDASVDVVVSFETIEHIDEAAQRRFIAEARRVLNADGVFIVSTPNRQMTQARGLNNEFHLHEMAQEELLEKLSSEFVHVELYWQSLWIYSDTARDGSSLEVLASSDGTPRTSGDYLIAACSDGEVPQLASLRKAPKGYQNLLAHFDDQQMMLRQHYEQSLSWRLTRPLRWIRSMF